MSTTSVTAAPTRNVPRGRIRIAAVATFVLLAVAGATLPWWLSGSPFILMLACHAVIAAIVALSLDMLTGNTGLLSFGHAAWYGVGAYVGGLVASSVTAELFIIVPVVLIATALFAAVIGAVLVRQIGKAFAILTLAFSQILYALVFVLSDWTGGEDGLQGVPLVNVAGQAIVRSEAWYWLLYAILIAALAAALYVRRMPLGKAWLAIRENPERARFVGISVTRLKLVSYVVSATLAALAGALFVLFNGAVSPEVLHWFESGKILMYVVVGGVGTIVGPVFGAVFFTFAEHYVSSATESWLIYFGGLFVLIVIVAPGGIFGVLGAGLRRVRRGGEAQP